LQEHYYKGKLYLIPSLLGETASPETLSIFSKQAINESETYFCENERECRRFLKKAGIERSLDGLDLRILDKDTEISELLKYCTYLSSGKTAALISDAGSPAVADPGSTFIKLCHEMRIQVVPVSGPSSILLALMASGLDGQHFTFNGYLPIKGFERVKAINTLESKALSHTQIFMETPYRNLAMFEDLMKALHPKTLLCIAAGLTTSSEYIFTTTAENWKKIKPPIHKVPAIFLLLKQ
jgi:16S rRNA (cytidine1402-2'-O)-methyltransferase